jgi:hypothetical protein
VNSKTIAVGILALAFAAVNAASSLANSSTWDPTGQEVTKLTTATMRGKLSKFHDPRVLLSNRCEEENPGRYTCVATLHRPARSGETRQGNIVTGLREEGWTREYVYSAWINRYGHLFARLPV